MTNTIITTRSTPFEFLMNYLRMIGKLADDRSVSVTAEIKPDDYFECRRCGEGENGEIHVLKFEKELDGRLISFTERTCMSCGEREYSV